MNLNQQNILGSLKKMFFKDLSFMNKKIRKKNKVKKSQQKSKNKKWPSGN